jgi:hypothetical protein
MAIVRQRNMNMHNKIYDSRTEFGATQYNNTADRDLEQHKIIWDNKKQFN